MPATGGYLTATRHPWPCLLFVLPLLAFYEVGVFVVGGATPEVVRNGADHWLRTLMGVWPPPLLLTLAFLACGVRCWSDRPGDQVGVLSGMVFESVTYALGLWGVRYQVKDVQRSVAFYTQTLGFKLDMQNLPAFGQVSSGNLKLILSGPGASGSRPMPGGVRQQPGGWNRIILQVADVAAAIEALKQAGLHLRNPMESGPGGKQVQLEDPDGNPIELFEPAR